MRPYDPRIMMLYAFLSSDANARARRARATAQARTDSTYRPQSPQDTLRDERERCRSGGVALGILAALAGIFALAVLSGVLSGNTDAIILFWPVVFFLGCAGAAVSLFQRSERAHAQLERLAVEERAARWREAKARETSGRERSDSYANRERRAHGQSSGGASRRHEDERRVADLRARYARGEMRGFDAPIALIPGETCYYVCNCHIAGAVYAARPSLIGQLVVTNRRLVIVARDGAETHALSDILRFTALDDDMVRVWLGTHSSAVDFAVDYPLETVASLLIACKAAGITPARPEVGPQR